MMHSFLNAAAPIAAIDDLEWFFNEAAAAMGQSSAFGFQCDRLREGYVSSGRLSNACHLDDRRLEAAELFRNVKDVFDAVPARHRGRLIAIHTRKQASPNMRQEFGPELVPIVALTDPAKEGYMLATGKASARSEHVYPWLESLVVGGRARRDAVLLSSIKIAARRDHTDAYRAYEAARSTLTEPGERSKAYPSNRRRRGFADAG